MLNTLTQAQDQLSVPRCPSYSMTAARVASLKDLGALAPVLALFGLPVASPVHVAAVPTVRV